VRESGYKVRIGGTAPDRRITQITKASQVCMVTTTGRGGLVVGRGSPQKKHEQKKFTWTIHRKERSGPWQKAGGGHGPGKDKKGQVRGKEISFGGGDKTT